jgi:hypothetical protein
MCLQSQATEYFVYLGRAVTALRPLRTRSKTLRQFCQGGMTAKEAVAKDRQGTTWNRNTEQNHCVNIIAAVWQNVASSQNHIFVWKKQVFKPVGSLEIRGVRQRAEQHSGTIPMLRALPQVVLRRLRSGIPGRIHVWVQQDRHRHLWRIHSVARRV